MSNLSEEEKEAIETMQHWIEYEKEHREEINKADELITMQELILGIIDKRQKEIEIVTKSYDKALDMLVDKDNKSEDLQNQIAELKDKLDTKDKAIDKMAEDLTTPIHSKEWIIKHYLKG